MSRVPRIVAVVIVGLLLAAPMLASADEAERAATYAVQNRKYRMGHELHAGIGVLPLNAFTKGLTLGGGYTYHINDLWAWEIAEFMYAFGLDTSLKTQLLHDFQVQPTQIESINYIGTSNILIKPMYGKYAFANRWLMHTELFLAVGGAFAKYINPSVFRPGFDIGLTLRIHARKYVSVRLDVRDYVFFKGSSPQNELFIALSLALTFGRDSQ